MIEVLIISINFKNVLTRITTISKLTEFSIVSKSHAQTQLDVIRIWD